MHYQVQNIEAIVKFDKQQIRPKKVPENCKVRKPQRVNRQKIGPECSRILASTESAIMTQKHS